MRSFSLARISFFLLALSIFYSCKKTERYSSEPLSDYMPLQVGKYITYRLDSTVYTNFGKNTETHSYRVKYVIDSQVQDNLGRPSFLVYRYITDSSGTQPWTPDDTYYITPLEFQIEMVEDNLRYIKLHSPITAGFTWKGNKYLPNNPYEPTYTFSNDDNMGDWDYYYDGSAPSIDTVGGQTYTNVLTVQEDDESYNVPVVDQSSYAARNYSVEKYAKNIGLVYRQLIMWEQQPNPTGTPPNVSYNPYRVGFGITLWMIDHN